MLNQVHRAKEKAGLVDGLFLSLQRAVPTFQKVLAWISLSRLLQDLFESVKNTKQSVILCGSTQWKEHLWHLLVVALWSTER